MHPATIHNLADAGRHSGERPASEDRSASAERQELHGMPPRGWEPILPQVAIHAARLKRRRKINEQRLKIRKPRLKPLNLCLVGEPGSDKTDGISYLYSKLGFKVSKVDSATLNDIAEIAGPQNMNANIAEGRLEFIRGELADADVIFLDEIVAIKSHVKPQLKLMLQGYLMLYGQQVPLKCVSIMAAGNLQEHLRFGNATQLDSSLADRMLMIAETPELGHMTHDNIDHVIQMDDEWDDETAAAFNADNAFESALFKAIGDIERNLVAVQREFSSPITRYIRSLVLQVHGKNDRVGATASASAATTASPFKFQGRRGQWVRMVIEGAFALCAAYRGEFSTVAWFAGKEFDSHGELLKATMWLVLRDCLGYHRLSLPPGEQLDFVDLLAKHETAVAAMGDGSVEALVAEAPTLAEKIALIVAHPEIAPEIKADVFGLSLQGSDDVALKIASKVLMTTERFKDELPALKELVAGVHLPNDETFDTDCEALEHWLHLQANAEHTAVSTQMEIDIFQVSHGDKAKIAEFTYSVNAYLASWGISPDELPKPPYRPKNESES